MSPLKTLAALGLVGLGLLFAVLTIGAFAQANPEVPFPLTLLRDAEGTLSSTLRFLPGTGDQLAYARGFAYMGLTIVFTSLAALFVAAPKSETVPRPGRPRSKGV